MAAGSGGTNYRRVARRKARKYGINPTYFTRQIQQESGFQPHVGSPAGAQGIAQIMPATARSWGVNPNRPRKALDAAAKHMAGYLRSYGGDWRKALAAYNAGEGAVAQYGGVPPYAETQNYVRTILRGGKPKQAKPGKAGSGGRRGTPGTAGFETRQSPTSGGTTVSDMLRAAVESGRGTHPSSGLQPPAVSGRSALKMAGAGVELPPTVSAPQAPAIDDILQTIRAASGQQAGVRHSAVPGRPAIPGQRGGGGGGKGGVKGFGGSRGDVAEMFWQGRGGVNLDAGKRVAQGYVSGHKDHVHVAGRTRKETLAIARRAQKMGLTVRELAPFDRVDPVHAQGSYHYQRSGAADVSGPARRMARFARTVARAYGY